MFGSEDRNSLLFDWFTNSRLLATKLLIRSSTSSLVAVICTESKSTFCRFSLDIGSPTKSGRFPLAFFSSIIRAISPLKSCLSVFLGPRAVLDANVLYCLTQNPCFFWKGKVDVEDLVGIGERCKVLCCTGLFVLTRFQWDLTWPTGLPRWPPRWRGMKLSVCGLTEWN